MLARAWCDDCLPEARVESYRADAARRLERFRGEAIARAVAAEVVPALLR